MEENNVKSTMSVKLVVNKKTGRIICAEARKKFVDLIFSFMSLQIGSVMELFSHQVQGSKEVGSAFNVYKSRDEHGDKSVLLNPQVSSSFSSTNLRIEQGERIEDGQICYICENNHTEFNFDGKDTTLHKMNKQAETVGSSGGDYVKEQVTFMITDDLKVTPTSTTGTVRLLKRLNILDVFQVEEHSVDVGHKEAVELLFASLTSTTALNDVFGAKVSTTLKRKRPLNDVSTSVKRKRK